MRKVFFVINLVILISFTCFAPLFIFHDTGYYLSLEHNKDKLELLNIWQVETFEGGTVNRLANLKKISTTFEKQNVGTTVFLRTIGAEDMMTLLGTGERPDIISFGSGAQAGLERYLLPQSSEYGLAAEMVDSGYASGKLLAIPYQMGAWVWISNNEFDDDFVEHKKGILVGNEYDTGSLISSIDKKKINGGKVYDSYKAYTEFRHGAADILLGGMRDVARLSNVTANSGESFFYKPTNFTNMVQYVGICSGGANEQMARKWIELLMSDSVQRSISSLGMFSPKMRDLYTAMPYADIESGLKSFSLPSLW